MIPRLLFAIIALVPLVSPSSVFCAQDTPSLAITNLGSELVLSWPASATNWTLEHSTHLRPSALWTRVPESLYHSNGTLRYVPVSAIGGSRFFRLRDGSDSPLNTPSLTGHWRLDEGSGENSQNVLAGGPSMVLANATWSAGRFGPGALRFNGGDPGSGGSRATISNTSFRVLPRAGQPFTVSLWLNADDLVAGWQGLIGNRADGSNGWHVALHNSGPGTNYIVFDGGSNSSLSLTGRTLLLPNLWYHLTVTHDGFEGAVYLNDNLLTRGGGTLATHDGPIVLGAGLRGLRSFLGRLDDVRTCTNALTWEQVSMKGHWRFDENSGNSAADSSVRGLTANLSSSMEWADGKDGAGLRISSGQASIDNTEYELLPASGGSFGLSFWVRPDLSSPGQSTLLRCQEENTSGWRLSLDTDLTGFQWLHFQSTNSGGTLDLRARTTLTNGLWSKIDLTFNGGIATLYVNARKIASGNGAIRGSRAPLVIGAVDGDSAFDGVLDELKVYGRERDASEIGPVARILWETVFLNSHTNLQLQGSGPADKLLTFSLLPLPGPTNGTLQHSPGSSVVKYSAGSRKGPDLFAYTVSDGEFTSEPATVTLSLVQPHWLSVQGGAQDSPDGTSPAQSWRAGTADALDAIWKTNNYYDCFFYAPGDYETRGWKFLERSSANPGCKHIGSGSTGANSTRLKLVDIWGISSEEMLFGAVHPLAICDNFEVRNMILDCNGSNLPKMVYGEPIVFRIPLTGRAQVQSARLKWVNAPFPGVASWRFGPPRQLAVGTRVLNGNTYVTNWSQLVNTGDETIATLGWSADDVLIRLEQRAAGATFYALAEIELAGAGLPLPSAAIPGGGTSRLDSNHSILMAVDRDPSTGWASGPEAQSAITLPLPPGTAVSQINLHWNCRTMANGLRLGAAASYEIKARDETTGQYVTIPFLRHPRTAAGWETNTFGTETSPAPVTTDSLLILLTERDSLVEYYSLREITLRNGAAPVSMPLPSVNSAFGAHSLFRAFDGDPATFWASGTQGAVTAINVLGSNLKFTNLKIVGFGTKAGRECFPIFVGFPGFGPPTYAGNVLIEDCVITQPAANNSDGLSAITLAANPPDLLTNAIVRGCVVSNVKSAFQYSHGIGANHVENCEVRDCEIGVYFEPEIANMDDIGAVLIRSNRFVNVDSGVHFLFHEDAHFGSITCVGNETILSGANGWGFAACDVCSVGPSGSISNFTVLDNIVRYADWLPRPSAHDGGIFYANMRHTVFGNNIIALGTPNALRVRSCPAGLILPPPPVEDCDHYQVDPPPPASFPPCVDVLLPGYRRAWFNNRDVRGDSLPIRFIKDGVDGPATQQQWAD